jgi:hypothetical protein
MMSPQIPGAAVANYNLEQQAARNARKIRWKRHNFCSTYFNPPYFVLQLYGFLPLLFVLGIYVFDPSE